MTSVVIPALMRVIPAPDNCELARPGIHPSTVIPAKAGIQKKESTAIEIDSCFRRNDSGLWISASAGMTTQNQQIE
jgi:hypothetical protein